jgi:hypothetical protein
MDTLTKTTVAQHLDVTRANLNLASYTPVELSLPFLEDALHNLEAAIDTLRIARATKAPTVSAGVDLARGPETTVVLQKRINGPDRLVVIPKKIEGRLTRVRIPR